jgi:hygromycin-B 4-O-kinase
LATRTDLGEAQRDFLRGRFGQAAEIAVMRPGEWSVAYSVRTVHADLVARFSVYDEDFEKDAYAARYSSTALPIPPIIEWGRALDGFYAIAPRMNGEHIDGLDETRMRRVLPSLLAALDAMRAVDLSSASGYGGWRADGRTSHRSWRDWLLRSIDEPATRGSPGLRKLLQDLPTVAAAFEESYARLVQMVEDCPEERALFHDDLINRNVLVDGDRITAVLDWGSSKYGDSLFDIANLVFYRPWFPAWRNIDFAAEARAHYDAIGLSVPYFNERITCYCLRIALDGVAYSAFRKRWDEVDLRAQSALEIARRQRSD